MTQGVGSLVKSIHDELQWKMPPIGLTEERIRIGTEVRVQYTLRCGANTCYFVGHAATVPDAQVLLDEHKCPHPPYRNELPTGLSTLEKCWDELDDATAALIDKREYNGMSGDDLKGYAKGIAFMLTMMAHPYFKTVKAVAQEAVARYKMHRDMIPFRPTPSYRYNPMPSSTSPNLGETQTLERRTAARSSRTVNRAKPSGPALSNEKVAAIQGAAAMFSHAEIATMYGITEARVREVLDTPVP